MLLLETLGRRWFAFAFIAGLFWAAWPEGGWRRALRFFVIASVVSFAAEYASTHTGFPYGRYEYVAGTQGDELYLSNVPLFVPVSFGVVVWAGRALALGTRATSSVLGLALLGAMFATAIDVVIDPMTLRGDEWFLGSLYAYEATGPWFDIPWSNFGGWLLVSAVVIGIDALLAPTGPSTGDGNAAALRGRVLAFGICAFFVVLAAVGGHWDIVLGGSLVTAMIALGARAREPAPSERP